MHDSSAIRHFSGTYAEARSKFLEAAEARNSTIESFVLETHRGALGETLAMDVAYLGPPGAAKLMIVSSGTHGPEGFCGSGCQVAALHDADLLGRVERAGIGLLLVHAVNPHGFSHLHRTNEDNVDLNRNHVNFDAPLPANAAYTEIEPFVLAATWPRSPTDEAAIENYIERHGERAFRGALVFGQYTSPDGVFYGGRAPTWSNRTLRGIVRKYGAAATHIGWIDFHTGLGPYGHGEKLYGGRNAPAEIAQARAWWGADVFTPFVPGESVAIGATGMVVTVAYDECPQALASLIGLEFGTLPDDLVLPCLLADTWLRRHPEAPAQLKRVIRQDLRDAFYCDNDEWKGKVLGQARVALLQTIVGLAAADATGPVEGAALRS